MPADHLTDPLQGIEVSSEMTTHRMHPANHAIAETRHEPPATTSQHPRPSWLWQPSDSTAVLMLICGGCLLALYSSYGALAPQPPISLNQPRDFRFRFDPNHANAVEWAQLPGVGPRLAERLVQHRQQHGPFRSIDELQRVKGIGEKTLEKLRPWLQLSPHEELAPTARKHHAASP